MPEIKRLDRLPVQAMPLCGGMDGGRGTHACHALRQPLCYPGMSLQPIQMLKFWPAARTGQPLALDFQLDRLIEHG